MLIPKTAPYGSWKSRVSSDLIAAQSISLSEPRLDGEQVYWLEGRPQELGRYALVKCHGGPTASASSVLDLTTQFWTSRGIAVLDVNHGGSTGFGRAFRDRLHLTW